MTAATAAAKFKQFDCWELATAAIGHFRRTLLYGPPGTGKTTLAYTVGITNPDQVVSLTLTESTPMAEIRGHYIPRGNEWIWQDGPGVKAWDPGTRLVINEIDHADGDVHSLLHALLDDMRVARITLPNGENVTPEPGFSCVATMNGEPGDLPPALLDRFDAKILIDKPNPAAIAALSEDLREPARRSVGIDDQERRVSIRSWVAFDAARAKLGQDMAAQMVFGANAKDIVGALQINAVKAAAR